MLACVCVCSGPVRTWAWCTNFTSSWFLWCWFCRHWVLQGKSSLSLNLPLCSPCLSLSLSLDHSLSFSLSLYLFVYVSRSISLCLWHSSGFLCLRSPSAVFPPQSGRVFPLVIWLSVRGEIEVWVSIASEFFENLFCLVVCTKRMK